MDRQWKPPQIWSKSTDLAEDCLAPGGIFGHMWLDLCTRAQDWVSFLDQAGRRSARWTKVIAAEKQSAVSMRVCV